MISDAVFWILAQDSTDVTPASVLSAVNARNKTELVEAQLPDYTYTSLKTLLGETVNGNDTYGNPKWAVNKIKSGMSLQKNQNIEQPENMPVIYVTSKNVQPGKGNSKNNYLEGSVTISVYTNGRLASSAKAGSIASRIRFVLNNYTSPSGFQTAKNFIPDGVKPVEQIRLRWIEDEEDNWDKIKSRYKAELLTIL